MAIITVKLDIMYSPTVDFKEQGIRSDIMMLLIQPDAIKSLNKGVYQINKTAYFTLDGEHYYSALMFNSTGGLRPTWHLYASQVECDHPVIVDKSLRNVIQYIRYAPVDFINSALQKNKLPTIKESHYKITDGSVTN